jgi:hypothetical protein
MYNCIKITDGSRVYYIHCFPPANNTTVAPSLDSSLAMPEQLVPDQVTLPTLKSICFGTGRNSTRRPWGRDNLPTTSRNWFSGIFIRDNIELVDGREGIIPFKTPFDYTTPVVPNSESWAWTMIFRFNGNKYKSYMTTQPMPQVALDVLLVLKVGGQFWIKLLRRGSNIHTVDFPGVLMSGAGEHLEPGTSSPKEDIQRALAEECGFNPDDYQGVITTELGKFSDPGRDPRYNIQYGLDEETGEPVQFGEDRESSTTLKLVFVKFDGDKLPVIKPHSDIAEVQYTFWCELNQAIAMNPKEFFLEENHSYMEIAKDWLVANSM